MLNLDLFYSLLQKFSHLNSIYIYLIAFLILFLFLYLILFHILRPIFRNLERDIALVTLNISSYPILIIFSLISIQIIIEKFLVSNLNNFLESIITASLILIISYWLVQIFKQVLIYYLKEYTQQTETMWDDVLLPLLEAVIPFLIFLIGGVLILKSFGVDLTGIWVALGGATFIIGFAIKDILANFFSGIVLLIDTPFQFGDVLCLEDKSIGMLRRIGVRVTQIYLFDTHSDVYIPNSILQNQNIINLSRPTSYYYYSTSIEIPAECELNHVKKVIEEAVLAHPDTLGDIEKKLGLINKYYCDQTTDFNLNKQQEIGKFRLLKEQEVNLKLEEIEYSLEALVVTLQFAEKGGLTQDEIDNIQQEYQQILDLIGLKLITENEDNFSSLTLQENQSTESLIELVREWYRIGIKDPNLREEDLYIIPQEWEKKINLLKKRTQRLYQKITNPKEEETRLDDYVLELINWFQERFKESKKWENPQIWMTNINHDEGYLYYEFKINFFVDDIKLEYGKRGDRISSQIYQEVVRIIKPRLARS